MMVLPVRVHVLAHVPLEHRRGNAHRCLLLRLHGPDADGKSEDTDRDPR
jgi:hypothetical protein